MNVFLTKRGFTLIELLLGLGIFTVVALSVYGILWGSLTVQRRVIKINQISREIHRSLKRLADDLESMAFYQRNDFSSTERVLWGDSHSLGFLKATPAGLKVISYFLEETKPSAVSDVSAESAGGNEKWALIREERPLRKKIPGDSDEASEEGRKILSARVSKDGLVFSYGYLKRTPGQESILLWEDELKAEGPPWVIRIAVTFLDSVSGRPAFGGAPPSFTVERDVFIPFQN